METAAENKFLLDRISIDSEILSGKPVVKGTRLSVPFILGLLAKGATFQDILQEYPGLVKEDIEACLFFAIQSIDLGTYLSLSV